MARYLGQAFGSKLRFATAMGAGVMLAGCSWLGGHTDTGSHYGSAQYGGVYGGQVGYGAANPCQIPHAQAAIPAGCNPAMVTVGTGGGFAQQPQFGAPGIGGNGGYSVTAATGGYGSHAHGAHGAHSGKYSGRKQPTSRLRANLSLSAEKSIMGTYLDPVNGLPFNYDPTLFDQTTVAPVVAPADGVQVTQTFTAREDGIFTNTISHDDVHSTPFSVGGGLEYGLNPRFSVFGNAGYTYAEGKRGQVARVEGFVDTVTTTQNFVANVGDAPTTVTVPGTEVVTLATVDYDYNDMNRVDLEVGGRYYFNPLHDTGFNITPFVSAAVGASHHNSQSARVTQRQLNYDTGAYFDVRNPGGVETVVDIYDSQWVPTGNFRAGVEWQASPRTALAFETGVRVEGGREYVNGNDEDTSLAIPLTVRGSFTF